MCYICDDDPELLYDYFSITGLKSIIILCVIYMTMTQNFYKIISLLQDSEYYNSMCYIRDSDPELLYDYFSITVILLYT